MLVSVQTLRMERQLGQGLKLWQADIRVPFGGRTINLVGCIPPSHCNHFFHLWRGKAMIICNIKLLYLEKCVFFECQ